MSERTSGMMERLKQGEIVEYRGKLYAVCSACCKIVCVNKRFFGCLHFCKPSEERKPPSPEMSE